MQQDHASAELCANPTFKRLFSVHHKWFAMVLDQSIIIPTLDSQSSSSLCVSLSLVKDLKPDPRQRGIISRF